MLDESLTEAMLGVFVTFAGGSATGAPTVKFVRIVNLAFLLKNDFRPADSFKKKFFLSGLAPGLSSNF